MDEQGLDGKNTKISQWEAVGFVWELLFLIAIPTLFFALLGRWIDTRFGISPWATLIGLFLALGACAFVVVNRGKRMALRMKSSRKGEPTELP